jgi:hypothetical protein
MKNIQDYEAFLESRFPITPLGKELLRYMMISDPIFFAKIAFSSYEPRISDEEIKGKTFKTFEIYDVPDKKHFQFILGIKKRTSGPNTGYFAAKVYYMDKNDEMVNDSIISTEYYGFRPEENLKEFDMIMNFVVDHYNKAKNEIKPIKIG